MRFPAFRDAQTMAVKAPEIAVFRQDGTWLKPAGAKMVDILTVGAGGGGSLKGDGANGELVMHSYDAGDLPDHLEVTVGRGGRGTDGGGDGADGLVVAVTRFEKAAPLTGQEILLFGIPVMDSGNDGCVDDDWLTQEFERAKREYEELPESARPVVVPYEPGSPEEKRRAALFGRDMPARTVPFPSLDDLAGEITKLSFGKSGDDDPESGGSPAKNS